MKNAPKKGKTGPGSPKKTVLTLLEAKRAGRPISAVTCYDFSTARWVDEAGVDLILVGDSLGMVSLGYANTTRVTMDEIIHHCRAVSRACPRALLVADMPFLSCHGSVDSAVKNVRRVLQEGGADAVKIEGGERTAPLIEKLAEAGVAVIGHIGLKPQTIKKIGRYAVYGKDPGEARALMRDAKALERAGAVGVLMECVREEAAGKVTRALRIPTISCGSGRRCDGQILVLYDMLGLFPGSPPKFVRAYARLGEQIREAVGCYVDEVRRGKFPGPEHVY